MTPLAIILVALNINMVIPFLYWIGTGRALWEDNIDWWEDTFDVEF